MEQLCYKAENIFNCSPSQVHYKMHPGGTVTMNSIFFQHKGQILQLREKKKKSDFFYIKCVCTTRDKRTWSFFRVSLRAGARGEVIDHLCLVSNTVQKHCAKFLSYLKHLLERGAARGKY